MQRTFLVGARPSMPGAGSLDDLAARLPVDAVLSGSVESVLARYQVVVDGDGLDAPPRVNSKVRVGVLCTELAAFRRLCQLPFPGDLLFEPSPVACLELWRVHRRTLVAARELPAGTVLRRADLALERGGPGVGEDALAAVLGRPLGYRLDTGAPIDFGVLMEPEGGRS